MRRRGARPRPPEPAVRGDVVVEARGVSVNLGGDPVLRDVDLAVASGEVVALVGPNGAGKSTLLAVLAGDQALDTGEVTVMGRRLDEWSGAELALRRAVLPQAATVTFPFTVRDIVEMGRAPWVAVDGDPDGDAAVDRAMTDGDVTHLAARSFPTLSGGERARAALARVLAQDAPVLLLDEPTAALDLHHQELVLDRAARAATEGAAVVVVLHDLGLAGARADRVVLLHDGSIVADGPPTEVLRADLIGAVYRHPVDVMPHPRTGAPLVLPRR